MATHAYQSLEEGGQIVVSDGPREDLEELARWVSIDPADAKKLIAAAKKASKTEGADDDTAAELEAAAEAEAAAKAAADLAAAGTPPAK